MSFIKSHSAVTRKRNCVDRGPNAAVKSATVKQPTVKSAVKPVVKSAVKPVVKSAVKPVEKIEDVVEDVVEKIVDHCDNSYKRESIEKYGKELEERVKFTEHPKFFDTIDESGESQLGDSERSYSPSSDSSEENIFRPSGDASIHTLDMNPVIAPANSTQGVPFTVSQDIWIDNFVITISVSNAYAQQLVKGKHGLIHISSAETHKIYKIDAIMTETKPDSEDVIELSITKLYGDSLDFSGVVMLLYIPGNVPVELWDIISVQDDPATLNAFNIPNSWNPLRYTDRTLASCGINVVQVKHNDDFFNITEPGSYVVEWSIAVSFSDLKKSIILSRFSICNELNNLYEFYTTQTKVYEMNSNLKLDNSELIITGKIAIDIQTESKAKLEIAFDKKMQVAVSKFHVNIKRAD